VNNFGSFNNNTTTTIQRGDIWFVDMNHNVINGSHLQGGQRPCVIISNNANNKFSPIVNIIPLTSRTKNNLPVHVNIGMECGLKSESIALIEQQQCIDKSKLMFQVGKCTNETLQRIEKAMFIQYNMNYIETIEKVDIVKEKEKIDMNYIKSIVLNIKELSKIKDISAVNESKKTIINHLKTYCNRFGRDYKDIVEELKNNINTTNKVKLLV
jgi:mRNA interferase MazF